METANLISTILLFGPLKVLFDTQFNFETLILADMMETANLISTILLFGPLRVLLDKQYNFAGRQEWPTG